MNAFQALNMPIGSRLFAPLASRMFALDSGRSMSLARLDDRGNMVWAFDSTTANTTPGGRGPVKVVNPSAPGTFLFETGAEATGDFPNTPTKTFVYRSADGSSEDVDFLCTIPFETGKTPIEWHTDGTLVFIVYRDNTTNDMRLYAYSLTGSPVFTSGSMGTFIGWSTPIWGPSSLAFFRRLIDASLPMGDRMIFVSLANGSVTLGPTGIRDAVANYDPDVHSGSGGVLSLGEGVTVGGSYFYPGFYTLNRGNGSDHNAIYNFFEFDGGGNLARCLRLFPVTTAFTPEDCPDSLSLVVLSGTQFVADFHRQSDFTDRRTARFGYAGDVVWNIPAVSGTSGSTSRVLLNLGWAEVQSPQRLAIYDGSGNLVVKRSTLAPSVRLASGSTSLYACGASSRNNNSPAHYYEWQPPL